jgi:hypothetical protein
LLLPQPDLDLSADGGGHPVQGHVTHPRQRLVRGGAQTALEQLTGESRQVLGRYVRRHRRQNRLCA